MKRRIMTVYPAMAMFGISPAKYSPGKTIHPDNTKKHYPMDIEKGVSINSIAMPFFSSNKGVNSNSTRMQLTLL